MSTIRGDDLLSETIEPMTKVIQQSLGVSSEVAEATCIEIITMFAHLWGGQVVYIPKRISVRTSKLHQQIYDDCNGRNHHEVATKHGVCVQLVYKVMKRMRLATIAKNQRDLFASPDDE
ncbi:Mor transcription activator family protein [Pseudomonas sp. 18175]|uniref:Mor transcription activator family protein n=1 Tax=Pseudomonas sp. 18175 TaxID=3390056 RepID=UPI003D196BD1